MKIWIPVLLLLAGVVGLVAIGIVAGGIPEVAVAELVEGDFGGRKVKLQGVIHRIDKATRPLEFVIRDMEQPAFTVDVEVNDVVPDLFKVDNDVAVEGYYDASTKRLTGNKLYTKCPSKYEAAERAGESSAQTNSSTSNSPAAASNASSE